MRLEFVARFGVCTNEETGEVFIVLSEKEIREGYAVRIADFEQTLDARRELGESEDSLKRALRVMMANTTAEMRRELADASRVSGIAKPGIYTLIRPDYGVKTQCRTAAMESGIWNGERYVYLLLCSQSVKKEGRILSADEIDGLEPEVADVLGNMLVRATGGDKRRLPFTLPESGPISPAT